MGKILSPVCSWEVEYTYLDTVGILLSLRKSCSLHCETDGFWETEANSSCHLPTLCLPHMQQDWKEVVDSASSHQYCWCIAFLWSSFLLTSTSAPMGFLCQTLLFALNMELRFSPLVQKRGIVLRGKETQPEVTKEEHTDNAKGI